MNAPSHDYHLVAPSPWPLVGSAAALFLTVGFVLFLADMSPWVLVLGVIILVATMVLWWRDVIHEANVGHHTPVVQLHHRYGMVLFILSEVMFFVAWFWAYFDASLFPADPAQTVRSALFHNTWPPAGITTFNPWDIPFLNTLVLLTSGTTVTWAHHAIMTKKPEVAEKALLLTIALGVCFTALQAWEYAHATFSFSGHIYGSTFFMATGFHGLHVLIGTIFLIVCYCRVRARHFTPDAHFGFEAAAWYWHFVDVVWLFLFACIYVWGAGTSTH